MRIVSNGVHVPPPDPPPSTNRERGTTPSANRIGGKTVFTNGRSGSVVRAWVRGCSCDGIGGEVGGGGFRKGSDRRTKPTSETDRGGGGMDANYEDGGARRMEAKVGRGWKERSTRSSGIDGWEIGRLTRRTDADEYEYEEEEYEEELAVEEEGEDVLPPVDFKEWEGLEAMAEGTRKSILETIEKLKAQGKEELVIMVVGKYGVGKASTANSLLGERVFPSGAFQPQSQVPLRAARMLEGFQVNFILAPALLEGDIVNDLSMTLLTKVVESAPFDCVLYVDRLDVCRVEGQDKQLIEALTDAFGAGIWDRTVLTLTHGKADTGRRGYDEYVQLRGGTLSSAIRKVAGGKKGMHLPVVSVENSSRCPVNANNEKILPNSTRWIPALFEDIGDVATTMPTYKYNRGAMKSKRDHNNRNKWLILPLFALQIAAKVLIVDRVIRRDADFGDQYGPFSKEKQEKDRARRMAKEATKKMQEYDRKMENKEMTEEDLVV